MKKNTEPELPPDIAEWLKTVPKVTQEMKASLRAAAKELETDTEFQSEVVKGLFVNQMLEAMEEQKLSVSEVARKWGRSRQYLHKLLNEDKRVNFTIETMVELAMVLKRRYVPTVLKEGEAAHVLRCVTRQSSQSISSEPFATRQHVHDYLTASFTPFESRPDTTDEDRLSA